MKSIKEQLVEQLSGKCVHFNGISNKVCAEGVRYEDVRDESQRPFRFPCLKRHHGGNCLLKKFPSPEQVERQAMEIVEIQKRAMNSVALVKDHIERTGKSKGNIDCPGCGGTLKYSAAEINGHISASCPSCSMGWIE
ncbi:hypothetical protein [Flagellimonas marina]|uniref:Uncharacterized protein n=1 Tax=Flagellimonas marina TaxID=1775168 RepID=A0ABV8PFN1_9FLAO